MIVDAHIHKIYAEVGAERPMWGSDMPNNYRTCTYRQCLDLVRLHFDFFEPAISNDRNSKIQTCLLLEGFGH